jgi:hypothetical protein
MTLLDFTNWDKKELLEKMQDDSFYYGYLGKAALSSSSVKLLLDSPKKYKYVTEYSQPESQALRDGRLFHLSVLEPDKLSQLHFVDVQSKNTKKYKEAKEEFGEVYTKKELTDAERLTDALQKNYFAMELIQGSEFEVPAIAEIFGYPFRGKADILNNQIIDLKTTQDLKQWGVKNDKYKELSTNSYVARKYGYDCQCYIYCNLFNKSYKDFKFLVIDKGTLDIGIYDVSEETYYRGEQKVEFAIETYNQFFQQGESLNDYIIRGTI